MKKNFISITEYSLINPILETTRLNSLFFALGITFLFFLSGFGVPVAVNAATFVVDDTTDLVDALPGDGVCATASGTCSLRAAIQEANALAGADTVTLPAGLYPLTLNGSGENAATTGDLDITDALRIDGAGAGSTTIDASSLTPRDRVFDVLGVTATLRRLAITGGQASTGGGLANDNGIVTLQQVLVDDNTATGMGGGVRNNGFWAQLRMTNSRVTNNNAATHGGGIANTFSAILHLVGTEVNDNFAGDGGGGIYNTHAAVATLDFCTFLSNEAGGVFSEGGGAYNLDADMTIIHTSFTDNTAGGGGGIYHEENTFFASLSLMFVTLNLNTATGGEGGGGLLARNGTVDVNLTTVEGNTSSTADGGGLLLDPDSNTFEVMQTSVFDNTASGNGGGIAYLGSSMGAGNISRSAIYNNTATNGAGIYLLNPSNFNMTVLKSTISGNNAVLDGGGLYLEAGMGTFVNLAHLTITNNDAPGNGGGIYVANNLASYSTYHVILADNTGGAGQNCDGDALTSTGWNIVGHDTGCNFLAQGSDMVGTLAIPIDPIIGPLQDNGGPTWTHELLMGSPAINNGLSCNAGGASDQRGFTMPVIECDRGAFERQ